MSFGFQLMRGVAWHYDGNRWTLCIVDVVARSQYNYTKKMSAVCHISQSLSPPQPAQAHLCTRLRGRRGKSLGGLGCPPYLSVIFSACPLVILSINNGVSINSCRGAVAGNLRQCQTAEGRWEEAH